MLGDSGILGASIVDPREESAYQAAATALKGGPRSFGAHVQLLNIAHDEDLCKGLRYENGEHRA